MVLRGRGGASDLEAADRRLGNVPHREVAGNRRARATNAQPLPLRLSFPRSLSLFLSPTPSHPLALSPVFSLSPPPPPSLSGIVCMAYHADADLLVSLDAASVVLHPDADSDRLGRRLGCEAARRGEASGSSSSRLRLGWSRGWRRGWRLGRRLGRRLGKRVGWRLGQRRGRRLTRRLGCDTRTETGTETRTEGRMETRTESRRLGRSFGDSDGVSETRRESCIPAPRRRSSAPPRAVAAPSPRRSRARA